jgi:TonB-dependent receptor
LLISIIQSNNNKKKKEGEMRKFSQYLFLSIFAFSSILFANGKIKGKIVDEDNLSLAGANVFVESLGLGAASDRDGEFILTGVPAGDYELKVSFIGYQQETQKVSVQDNRTTLVNLILRSGVVVGEEVVVIGDRLKGQAKALNQQKNNFNITNIVSADQIGRFPDANIGDALKRIPSLSVAYDQGEARFINIRGTEPRLNSVMINGERVPSAEAEIRSVQVDLIPSDMIQTIEVSKAVTPDMEADAIGGSVNLITRTAPNGLRISGTLGSGYNFLSELPQFIGSGVIGTRFNDNTMGLVISGNYHMLNLGSNDAEGNWYEAGNGSYAVEEWDIRKYEVSRLRQSISAEFDWQLNPTNTLYLKSMYNHRNDWENRYRLTYKMGDGLDDVEVRRQTKGGPNNNDNDGARLEDQRTLTMSMSGQHLFADKISADWSVAYSKASEERPGERYIGWRVKHVPFTADLSDTRTPYFNPVNAGDVANNEFSLKELTQEHQYTDEKDLSMKFNVEIPFSMKAESKNSIKFGAKYKKKDKKRDNNFYEYKPVNGVFDNGNMASTGLIDVTVDDFEAGSGYKSGYFTSKDYLGSLNLDNSAQFNKSDAPAEYAADNFTATEKVLSAYAMWMQNLSKDFSVIAGVRMEKTDVEYNGNQFDENDESVIPTSGSDDYINFLPGIHLRYNLGSDRVLRFAWTNTIARPNYYDLVPFRNISEDYEELEVGNPELEPTTSMNFDLMYEDYLESIGIVSAGAFYKSIKDYIYTDRIDDYVDPVSGNTYEEYYKPKNGAEATLYGLEASFQRQLDFIPDFGHNLGIYLNYTYTYSEAKNPVFAEQTGDDTIELPGTSPHTLNAALTYQDEALVLGLSFNYTAAYLDPDELDLTPGLERYYDAATYLDFNGSYAFTKQLRFFIEVNNILNQPLRYYAGDPDRTYQAEYYNVRMNAGIKFDL